MINVKIKVIFLFSLFIFVILTLFSIFYNMQTFFNGTLIEYSGMQMIQVPKNDETDFYKNKTIYIKQDNTTYKTYIQTCNEDGNFYYLSLSKYFYNSKDIKNIWIYNKKVSLIKYVFSSFFDF